MFERKNLPKSKTTQTRKESEWQFFMKSSRGRNPLHAMFPICHNYEILHYPKSASIVEVNCAVSKWSIKLQTLFPLFFFLLAFGKTSPTLSPRLILKPRCEMNFSGVKLTVKCKVCCLLNGTVWSLWLQRRLLFIPSKPCWPRKPSLHLSGSNWVQN